jgi:acyl-CoA dehydrogenase
MSWDFETGEDYQELLTWAGDFVREECEPLDFVVASPFDTKDPVRAALIPPLQNQVREQGLWACHLDPELGGAGFGQLKLALLNEILGTGRCAPTVFGCQAPDSGNSEILARYGTAEQKARYLEPLLDNRIVSAFSMTEPQAGSDPKEFICSATRDGEEWVINGEKWFTSNARYADFLIVMAVTDPGSSPYDRMTMFIVPADTPGVVIKRHVGGWEEPAGHGSHAFVSYENVRVPAESVLGRRGGAFEVAQSRLGGGRVHHAMRTVGQAQRLLDMICERVLSRRTQGELLSRKQTVQEMIADSWIELESFRLLVLRTAWKIDRLQDYKLVRGDISAIKAAMERVMLDIVTRAVHIHGSLGWSNELPFLHDLSTAFMLGLADGPTEVHKVTLARQILSERTPAPGTFPTRHLPALREQAKLKYASVLEATGADVVR